jgi:NAD(P)-dependent dehydrogenase (short-subunit alcohol dehydrogenase family)
MNKFEGLVVLVTGGTSGIGRETASLFASKGSEVVIFDREIEPSGSGLHFYKVDVTDSDSIKNAIDAVEKKFGRLDILINNAGISSVGTVEEASEEDWHRVLNINVVGVARVSAASLPLLRNSECASIVNVCSIAALNGLPQRAVYSASKGAILSLTYAMATDHVKEGIRVNCVIPGTVATPFVEKMLQNFPDPIAERAALNARQATGRMVSPREVAGAILYLADPQSGSTTGTALEVDGGVTHLRSRN